MKGLSAMLHRSQGLQKKCERCISILFLLASREINEYVLAVESTPELASHFVF